MEYYAYEQEVESSLAQQNGEKTTFPRVSLAVITNTVFIMKKNHAFHLVIVSPLEECHLCWEVWYNKSHL